MILPKLILLSLTLLGSDPHAEAAKGVPKIAPASKKTPIKIYCPKISAEGSLHSLSGTGIPLGWAAGAPNKKSLTTYAVKLSTSGNMICDYKLSPIEITMIGDNSNLELCGVEKGILRCAKNCPKNVGVQVDFLETSDLTFGMPQKEGYTGWFDRASLQADGKSMACIYKLNGEFQSIRGAKETPPTDAQGCKAAAPDHVECSGS